MKAICRHNKGYEVIGIAHYANDTAVLIQCNNCEEEYHGFTELDEEGAVQEMKNNPVVIDITGYEIEEEFNTTYNGNKSKHRNKETK